MVWAGSGTERQLEQMERDAEEERTYNAFATYYIYSNMRPESTGKYLWDLMWDQVPYRESKQQAIQDAKGLAKELGVATKILDIKGAFFGPEQQYAAIPVDWNDLNDRLENRYKAMRSKFISELIINSSYPDIGKIATEVKHPKYMQIANYYRYEIIPWHDRIRSS